MNLINSAMFSRPLASDSEKVSCQLVAKLAKTFQEATQGSQAAPQEGWVWSVRE